MEDLYSEYNYNTLSGLILQQLGHVPKTGELLQWNDFLFEIVDMDGARIDKILVTLSDKTKKINKICYKEIILCVWFANS